MNITWTCLGCPMQAEGAIDDGRKFYFRYRWGKATFGIGATVSDAVRDPGEVCVAYGDSSQGVLDEDEADRLLRRLMSLRLPGVFVRSASRG